MSADCLFVLRKCTNPDKLKIALLDYAKTEKIGLWFDPQNGLLECKQILMEDATFLFEPTSGVHTIDSGLLLVPDAYSINGELPSRPFPQRAQIIQDLGKIGMQFAASVEIYISDDNPFLPDYRIYVVTPDEIKKVLLYEEGKVERQREPIPCILIQVFGK